MKQKTNFGHRWIDENFRQIEAKLEEIIRKLIREYEYVDFFVGRDGDFDRMVASMVRIVRRDGFDFNSSLVWVMPYTKAEYYNNRENFDKYYDEIEVCDKSYSAHPKSAIKIRNEYMIDRSDLTVFYVTKDSGGAYKAMKYAMQNKKNIINLAE